MNPESLQRQTIGSIVDFLEAGGGGWVGGGGGVAAEDFQFEWSIVYIVVSVTRPTRVNARRHEVHVVESLPKSSIHACIT